jgi:site-specific DNA-methyltransferase (adenine-specific)
VEVANKKGKGQHPTAKPEELYKWLLERYCPEGGTMLDPTAGSFNSCFTAREMGLKAIGIEKDSGFFWKAVSRL